APPHTLPPVPPSRLTPYSFTLLPRPPTSPPFPSTPLFRSRPPTRSPNPPQHGHHPRTHRPRSPHPHASPAGAPARPSRAHRPGAPEEHTPELQSRQTIVCRPPLDKQQPWPTPRSAPPHPAH